MKQLFNLILFAVLIVLCSIELISADNRIKVGIVSADAGIYGKMTSFLSKSSSLQVIERRDLAPLFKELELKQAGAVSGKTDSQIKGIDYLIIVDEIWNGHSARIVRLIQGRFLFHGQEHLMNLRRTALTSLSPRKPLKISRI